ncbi:type 4b pilus protein PilO2 [Bordetella genomosp. 1]|uniref:Type 4b pilus protein PilO2 n=1 Tax=Bordetella genomosp. 1 TaxID=1395607 RepID=A0ABX4EUR8_9BORD|nr:type 4b pilus protein PilO2 [Bordetella genomosp. 1]OZI57923.1 hypothetical protein CAL27_21260 [Bordetella genomosp. 1]
MSDAPDSTDPEAAGPAYAAPAAAGRAALFAHAQPDAWLVYGLHWCAVLGSHAPALARLRARQSGATHFITGGARVLSCGCLRLTRADLQLAARPGGAGAGSAGRARILMSAAQAFACLAQGQPRAGLAALPDGRWWLVAAQDGAVLSRADRIFDTRSEAADALQALLEQHPALRACDAEALSQQFSRCLVPAARMQVVRRWHPVPLACAAFALLGGAWAVASPAWRADAATAHAARSAGRPPAVLAVAPPPRIQHGQTLPDALRGFGRLPLGVQGWRLEHARCTWQAMPAGWACRARYRRVAAEATSARLDRVRPKGWALGFPSLDDADLRWHVAGRPTLAFDPAAGAGLGGLGVLQTHRPSLASLHVAPPRPAGADMSGGAIQARRRSVSLQGPLRVVAGMPWPALHAQWRAVGLRLDLGSASRGAQSPMLIDVEGDLYER